MKGIALGTGLYVWLLLLLLVCGLLLGAVRLGVMPFVMQQETRIQRSTIAYQDSKAALLLKLVQDYEHPEASSEQKRAIVNRIRAEVAMLPAEQVPAAVTAFLGGRR